VNPTFISSLPGHAAAGMTGAVLVRPGAVLVRPGAVLVRPGAVLVRP